ncbi:MAG: pseudouridine synthase [Spirochaetia bacterium]|nr:pseudouridine synthase [Spirochaetia bacterium]
MTRQKTNNDHEKEKKQPESDEDSVRISRFLSKAGLCSRRAAKEFIEKNKVYADGKLITEPGVIVSKESELKVNENSYSWEDKRIIYILNKPEGYVCSHKSHKMQPSIFSLLPKNLSSLFFAGRLDKDSCGLVLLSNDGDLIFNLTHPSKNVQKKYIVHASRPLSDLEKNKAIKGVFDNNEKLKFDKIIPLKNAAHYEIILHTGRNREIRRILQKFGIKPLKLKRIELGSYKLDGLPEGKYLEIK